MNQRPSERRLSSGRKRRFRPSVERKAEWRAVGSRSASEVQAVGCRKAGGGRQSPQSGKTAQTATSGLRRHRSRPDTTGGRNKAFGFAECLVPLGEGRRPPEAGGVNQRPSERRLGTGWSAKRGRRPSVGRKRRLRPSDERKAGERAVGSRSASVVQAVGCRKA
ncbi:MAG: hypothetical protein MdMp014T_1367 [Treponematales bacterium]